MCFNLSTIVSRMRPICRVKHCCRILPQIDDIGRSPCIQFMMSTPMRDADAQPAQFSGQHANVITHLQHRQRGRRHASSAVQPCPDHAILGIPRSAPPCAGADAVLLAFHLPACVTCSEQCHLLFVHTRRPPFKGPMMAAPRKLHVFFTITHMSHFV